MDLNARDLRDVALIIDELVKIEENTGKTFEEVGVWEDGNHLCTIKSTENGTYAVEARP